MISSLRCLPNKVEKRINELPELLPSLFSDFMEIKSLHFDIFYYRIHNKAGVPILLEDNILLILTVLLLTKESLKWYFMTTFFAQMDFMLNVHAVINLAYSEKE